MKNIIQIQVKVGFSEELVWFDFLEMPQVNDMSLFVEAAKKDYPGREIRIVQVVEE